MPPLHQTIKTRGYRKTIKRLLMLMNRYGVRSHKIKENLENFTRLARTSTLFIPARILMKHPHLYNKDMEYAVHGYRHSDYSRFSVSEIRIQMIMALKIFNEFEGTRRGFRAPYLKVKDDTLALLHELGFLYDSSSTFHWNVIEPQRMNHHYKRILDFYKPFDSQKQRSLPIFEGGMLRIPVSLPDDEMLIDRLKIKNQDLIYDIWSDILKQAYERNEMFVLLLHPERFHLADKALGKLLEEANNQGMWIPSLKDLANWWINKKENRHWPNGKRGVFCITGDIDSVSLFDYFYR